LVCFFFFVFVLSRKCFPQGIVQLFLEILEVFSSPTFAGTSNHFAFVSSASFPLRFFPPPSPLFFPYLFLLREGAFCPCPRTALLFSSLPYYRCRSFFPPSRGISLLSRVAFLSLPCSLVFLDLDSFSCIVFIFLYISWLRPSLHNILLLSQPDLSIFLLEHPLNQPSFSPSCRLLFLFLSG